MMDVEAHARRIGYPGPLIPSAETLRELHVAHTRLVPFENLDVLLGRPIALNRDTLFRKIVLEGRGGYCFELNGLFADLLESIGFTVRHLMARVLRGGATLGPHSHRLMSVTWSGQSWVADVGFGGHGPIAPLPLRLGAVGDQYAERFRLVQAGGTAYRLDCHVGGNWEPQYTLSLDSHLPVDYTYANYYHSHSPDSIFTRQRICMKPTPAGRVTLVDRTLSVRAQGGTTRATIRTLDEYREALKTGVGLTLPEADLHACFEGALVMTA